MSVDKPSLGKFEWVQTLWIMFLMISQAYFSSIKFKIQIAK